MCKVFKIDKTLSLLIEFGRLHVSNYHPVYQAELFFQSLMDFHIRQQSSATAKDPKLTQKKSEEKSKSKKEDKEEGRTV